MMTNWQPEEVDDPHLCWILPWPLHSSSSLEVCVGMGVASTLTLSTSHMPCWTDGGETNTV
jgi:hypothetical protein